MAERPDKTPKIVNLALDNPNLKYEVKTGETPEERASRLRREEAEDVHKLRIELIVHIFAMTILAIAFLASLAIVAFSQKSGMPEKAMTIIAGIAGAVGGYLTGKKSKWAGKLEGVSREHRSLFWKIGQIGSIFKPFLGFLVAKFRPSRIKRLIGAFDSGDLQRQRADVGLL